jgi:serine/threonine protein kinase
MNPYKKNKTIKVFKGGIHAKKVSLLENNVVKKEFDVQRRKFFLREVKAMKKLQKCSFIPRLLWVHPKKSYYYMQYCGRTIDLTTFKQNKNTIDDYADELLKNGYYHNDLKPSNVTIDSEGKYYLIDLSWANKVPYKVEEGRKGYNNVNDYLSARHIK